MARPNGARGTEAPGISNQSRPARNCGTPTQFNEGYFRLAVAKVIVFRETDRLVARSEWYQADRGYKANIVTYAIAWLVNHLEVDRRQAIDLQAIWSRQELPEELKEVLLDVARHVADAIKDTPESARNVGDMRSSNSAGRRSRS